MSMKRHDISDPLRYVQENALTKVVKVLWGAYFVLTRPSAT